MSTPSRTPASDLLAVQRELAKAKASLLNVASLCLFAGTVSAIVLAFTR